MNLSLDLSGPRAVIRVSGYLSPHGGKNLAVLLRDLGRMGIETVVLDLASCSPVCVSALEILLDAKFVLAGQSVEVRFRQPPHTVSKVFKLMGLGSDGEVHQTIRHD